MTFLIGSFLSFPGVHPSLLNLLVLQNVSECDASHVSIVSSFVIVREEALTIVVATIVLRVELASKVVFELVIVDAFLVDLPQTRVVESLGVVS